MRRVILPVLAMVLLALSLSATRTRAADDAELDLPALVTASLEVYNERSDDPLPFLTPEQLQHLADGDVVRVRRRPAPSENGKERPERVTGFLMIRQPRDLVWVAALDPQFRPSRLLTEVRLSGDGAGGARLYQHLSLPWPITDRHWVIDLAKNTQLAESTDGFAWETRWRLSDGGPAIAARAVADGLAEGLTPDDVKDAIYLPANEGAWIVFALDENVTLLAYRVVTVVGGDIPDSWIATFAMAQLEGLLRDVARHTLDVGASYDPERSPVYGGDGRIIERLPPPRE